MADVKICCSYTELVNTDKLVAHPKNPNKHPERQIIILGKIMIAKIWILYLIMQIIVSSIFQFVS